MFGSASIYNMSPQPWEDLESISLPSLSFLQLPDTPLEDEADHSDMAPLAFPVLEPHPILDSHLSLCNPEAPGEDVLVTELLGRLDLVELCQLHVLVCGLCHSVFNVIDQFRQHVSCCRGETKPVSSRGSVGTVALALW